MKPPELKIYKASAGSGKTYTLALEYIRELVCSRNEDAYQYILAVTFTNDATSEMKERILAELYGLAFNTPDSKKFLASLQKSLHESNKNLSSEEIQNRSRSILNHILANYSRLNIITIDSFFQHVLRNLARELGTGSRFNLEMDTEKVLSKASQAIIEKASQKEYSQLLDWLTTYIQQKLSEAKSWNIEKEIVDFSRCIYNEYFQENEPVLREQLINNPKIFQELNKEQRKRQKFIQDALAKSCERYNELLSEYNIDAGEISNGKEIPTFLNKAAKTPDDVSISNRMLGRLETSDNWIKKTSKQKDEILWLAEKELMPLLAGAIGNISEYKTSRIITKNLHQLGLVWYIREEIVQQNKANNRFILSDTSRFLNQMIDKSDAPFIYEKIGASIHHVMIDEFQDTSRLQWENFKVLLEEIIAQDNFSLIVGDVKQSIYRWRNGNWRILSDLHKEFPAQQKTLEKNYRSQEVIVDFNNQFFSTSAAFLDTYTRKEFKQESPFLTSYDESTKQEAHHSNGKGFVSLDFIPTKGEDSSYDDLMQETVLEKLILLHEKGIPAEEICILCRKNKHIIQLGEYLAIQREIHPELAQDNYLNVVSNEAFQLNSSLSIRIIIEILRLIADPNNTIARAQLDYYLNQIGTKIDLEERREELASMPLIFIVSELYVCLNLSRLEGETSYLFAFYDALFKYLNDHPSDIPQFLEYWDEKLFKNTISTGEGVKGIRAMTIHRSKGLQFHSVIVPYCDWKFKSKETIVWCGAKSGYYDLNLLPVSYSKGMKDSIFEEEYIEETLFTWMDNLNELYVAFTRAEDNLFILSKEGEIKNNLSTAAHLLYAGIGSFVEAWDKESNHFEKGAIETYQPQEIKDNKNENPLRQTPPPLPTKFISHSVKNEKIIFRQSNQSREFLFPDRPTKEQYVAHGNIMHKLFEQINTLDDIDSSIQTLIMEGVIVPEKAEEYRKDIISAIEESNVEHWFSGKSINYHEATILLEEDGEVIQKRPDRILFSPEQTTVIDFKFGIPHKKYHKQVRQYMDLLESMNYPNVKGFLWYAEERIVEAV